MSNIPSVIDLVVNNDFCIGCGVCVSNCRSNAIGMNWNDNGFLVPKQKGNCDGDGNCIKVCPFNPTPKKEVRTEDELSEIFLPDASHTDEMIGKYSGVFAGYAHEFRSTSSSGGIASYLFSTLLEKNIVDHVISVTEGDNEHYTYSIISDPKNIIKSSQTKYYPVSLADVFQKIEELKGNVAIVGVGCFIKAIRLAQFHNPILKEKIKFLISIVCGGVKSRFFTEYLASKSFVGKDQFEKPEFRVKDHNSTAGDYSFACINSQTNEKRFVKMKSVGDMWGTGLFKANACDFCDDVTSELGDISLGDAWMNPYMYDGRGTNVIVTRSSLSQILIEEGRNKGKLYIEEIPLEKFIESQQGSFNHRRTGLPYRIKQVGKSGVDVPPKRIDKCCSSTLDFRIVQYYRMKVRKLSLEIWKDNADSTIFNNKMEGMLSFLKKLTKIYHYKRALFSKDVLNKIARRLKK